MKDKKKVKAAEEAKTKETGVKLTDEEMKQINAGMNPAKKLA